MISTKEFIDKYLGKIKGYPTDSDYPGECLSIVKLYIKEHYGIEPPPSGTNSAYGYWSKFPDPLGDVFEKVINTDTLVPEEGWIAVWQPWSSNQFGHISIVASGSTTGILKNWAQNWTSRTFQLESNRYTNVVGFLKPKEVASEPTVTDDEEKVLKFLRDQNANEGMVREAFGALSDSPAKNKQIQTLQTRVLDLENSQKDLEDRLTALESNIEADLKLITDWQSKYETANKALSNANKSNQEISAERNQYKKWYEAKCEEVKKLDKMTAWQHIKYGISLLSIKK